MPRILPSTAVTKRSKVQSEAAPDIDNIDQDSVSKAPGRTAIAKKMGGRDRRPKKQPVPAKKTPAKKDFLSFSGLYNKKEVPK